MQRRVWCLLLVGVNADTTPFPYTLRASHSASATTDGNWSDPDDSFEMAVALMAVSSLIGFCVVTIVESCWAKDIEDAKDELLKRRAILEGLRILYEEEESSSSEDAPSLGMEHGVLNLWQPKEFYDVLINLGQQKGPNPDLLQSVSLSLPYLPGDQTRVPSECSEAETESENTVSESPPPPVFETLRLSTVGRRSSGDHDRNSGRLFEWLLPRRRSLRSSVWTSESEDSAWYEDPSRPPHPPSCACCAPR